MIPAASASGNNTSGNGQFGALLRKRGRQTIDNAEQDVPYFEHNDRRMRFNNAEDPIHFVFNMIEDRPLKSIAKEFVKDSLFEITNFVSKVVG